MTKRVPVLPAFYRKPKKTVTVAGILAGFLDTVDQLRQLTAEKDAEAAHIRNEVKGLRLKAFEAEQEADRAQAAADKIQALVS